jgi:hypothetical protein
MPSLRSCCIVLVIRLTPSLTLIVVWIISNPSQKIGRGFNLYSPVHGINQDETGERAKPPDLNFLALRRLLYRSCLGP